jgi:hypothetical protein
MYYLLKEFWQEKKIRFCVSGPEEFVDRLQKEDGECEGTRCGGVAFEVLGRVLGNEVVRVEERDLAIGWNATRCGSETDECGFGDLRDEEVVAWDGKRWKKAKHEREYAELVCISASAVAFCSWYAEILYC